MSPEQFTGKALDARSDIYSLGVMAYEMLTGKLPFEADTPWQWATQHMTVQPASFEKTAPTQAVPEGMRRAIMKSLAKARDDRQATVREFFTELSDGGRMTDRRARALAEQGGRRRWDRHVGDGRGSGLRRRHLPGAARTTGRAPAAPVRAAGSHGRNGPHGHGARGRALRSRCRPCAPAVGAAERG